MEEKIVFKRQAAELIEKLAFALEEDKMEGDDPELPFKLLKEADKLKED